MTVQGNNQGVDAGVAIAATRFPLLRRLSIISLLAMLVTAAVLIFLYRQDQLAEHEKIAAQENEKTSIHLIHLLGERINTFIAATEGFDTQALRGNPHIGSFNATLDTIREHHILKLKLYNPSGVTVFSSIPGDIGGTSNHPALLRKTLQGETLYLMEFHKTFLGSGGELRDRYVAHTYMPLTHAEKRIGAIEILADATPIIDRIHSQIIQIALLVFGIFAALYAALFFSARRADMSIAEDTRKLAESEARLWATVNSALDAVISIDAASRLIGFNPAAETIFGRKRGEVIGQSMTELLIPERYRDKHQNGLARYMQTGETHILGHRIEITALRRDGTEFPIELTVTPIREGDRVIFTAYIRDISKRKQAEKELRESRAFHQSVTDAMGEIGIGLFIVDADHRIRFMNTVMNEWFGEQTGKICYSSLCNLTERCSYCRLDEVLCESKTVRYTPTITGGRIFDIIATPIQNRDGTISKLEVIRDVTELRKSEQELRIAAKAFESQEGMCITDADGVIQRVNKAFVETTGYNAEEVVGKTFAILKSGKHEAEFYQAIREALERNDHWQGEIWNRRKNGEIYPEWQTVSVVRGADGQITHYVYVSADISLRKKSEEQIRTLAFYDPLTQLPNRRLLVDRLKQALVINARNKRQGALLFIDLDNFKSLNDTQGHDTGDLMLVEAATRLQTCVRQCDTAARVGGDEFVVLLDDLDADETTAAAQTEAVGEKIRSALGQTYTINGHEYHSTASIGATLLRGSVGTADEMLRRADVGLYQAKADGRNTLRFFDPALQALVMARVAMETDLRRAVSFNAVLGQEQFMLHYQPQVDSSGHLTGAEALVRWKHPERGMVSPAEFIPLAEETGLILPLGHWVLTTACQQLAIWAERPEMVHLTVAVNVSARQFRLPNFVDEVLALVDYFGVKPGNLKLEITESMLLDNVDEMIVKMVALKAKGINFSLDDFGTGYSSLSYLKRLPIYQLKIDQSFVRDILTDPNDAAIAKTIVALSQSMGLAVIAEGVETEGQRDLLALQGCHNYQGYFFSRPLPVEQFDAFASSMHSAKLIH